jgi:hypothetical protein
LANNTDLSGEDHYGHPSAHRSRDEDEEPPLSEVRWEDQFAADPLQALPRNAEATEEEVVGGE